MCLLTDWIVWSHICLNRHYVTFLLKLFLSIPKHRKSNVSQETDGPIHQIRIVFWSTFAPQLWENLKISDNNEWKLYAHVVLLSCYNDDTNCVGSGFRWSQADRRTHSPGQSPRGRSWFHRHRHCGTDWVDSALTKQWASTATLKHHMQYTGSIHLFIVPSWQSIIYWLL